MAAREPTCREVDPMKRHMQVAAWKRIRRVCAGIGGDTCRIFAGAFQFGYTFYVYNLLQTQVRGRGALRLLTPVQSGERRVDRRI